MSDQMWKTRLNARDKIIPKSRRVGLDAKQAVKRIMGKTSEKSSHAFIQMTCHVTDGSCHVDLEPRNIQLPYK